MSTVVVFHFEEESRGSDYNNIEYNMNMTRFPHVDDIDIHIERMVSSSLYHYDYEV